ncbi:MAG: hybrid sensor histidine kinase/response regulator [Zetaproteobacteria bacterium CG_4_9_14_3_um_filter_53_7]|nr:MAG: hybrid sensor histidine kinase/response regulator [Zetaproteobacteria bacterium CG_4_9_14_3_um_filter_53_7]
MGFPAELCDFFEATMNQAFESSEPSRQEFTLTGPNGQVTLDWLLNPEFADDGTVISLLNHLRDITKFKKNEQALEQTNALLKALRDSIPDLIFYKDMDGVYLGCNQAQCDFIGKRSEEEVIGLTDFDLFDNDRANFFRNKDAEMLNKGIAQRNDEWVCNAMGENILLDTLKAPFRDANNHIIGLIGISRDITERHQTKQAIQSEQERAQTYLNIAGVMMIAIDKKQTVTLANRKACEILGYAEDEIVGRNWFDQFIPQVNVKQVKSIFDQLMTGNEKLVEYYTNPIVTKSGEERIIEWHNSDIRDESGAIIGILSSGSDITDLKEMEMKFYQAQKMEAIGTLVGGIAHDFNNMLAAISGTITLVEMDLGDQPALATELSRVNELCFNAADMISQLMTFARKNSVALQSISFSSFVNEALKLAKVGIPANIKFTQDICNDDLVINGNISQLQQIIMNLINNARDATDGIHSPEIQISLKLFLPDKAFLHKHQIKANGHAYAQLSIIDNGCGIEKELLQHIFEPFFTTKEQGKGTGLGLAMVFGAIQSHHGLIDVESTLHAGTRFDVYLPLQQKAINEFDLNRPLQVIYGKGETILIADDDKQVRDILSKLLTGIGYQVLQAEDGNQAIELFKNYQHEVALLILDVIMPDMGGIEAAARIRTWKPSLPVLYATGYDKNNVLINALKEDGSQVIGKPFTIALLSRMVRELLDR